MAKKPGYSLKNNRWLYVGFVALGVMAIWFGVLLGNFLLNKVVEADPLPDENLVSSVAPKDYDTAEPQIGTVSADYPDPGVSYAGNSLYRVRVGSYANISQAKTAETNLISQGFETYVVGAGGGPFYVQVGAFREKQNADNLKRDLETKGYEVYIMQ